MEGVGAILMLAILVAVFFVVRNLMVFLMRRGQGVLFVILLIVTMPIVFIGFFAYISANTKLGKERFALYNDVAAMPSDQKADELISYIEKYGCVNNPEAWNRLRAVWFAVNESPNVTTDKKNELKKFLMLRGLTMHYNDAKVIDNYGR